MGLCAWHMSRVTCQMSDIACHMLHIMCHMCCVNNGLNPPTIWFQNMKYTMAFISQEIMMAWTPELFTFFGGGERLKQYMIFLLLFEIKCSWFPIWNYVKGSKCIPQSNYGHRWLASIFVCSSKRNQDGKRKKEKIQTTKTLIYISENLSKSAMAEAFWIFQKNKCVAFWSPGNNVYWNIDLWFSRQTWPEIGPS